MKNISMSYISISYFSSSEFCSSEFPLSESEEISISSMIYLGIFFSLTMYLHSSKNTWG